jgi:hypothetical protein
MHGSALGGRLKFAAARRIETVVRGWDKKIVVDPSDMLRRANTKEDRHAPHT